MSLALCHLSPTADPSRLTVFTARRDLARAERDLDVATDDLASALAHGGLALLCARARFARADRALVVARARMGRANAERDGAKWLTAVRP